MDFSAKMQQREQRDWQEQLARNKASNGSSIQGHIAVEDCDGLEFGSKPVETLSKANTKRPKHHSTSTTNPGLGCPLEKGKKNNPNTNNK